MSFPTNRILKLCEARGLSPAQASVLAGLSHDYIRNLIRGTIQQPTFAKLSALSNLLSTNPLYLAEHWDDPRSTSVLAEALRAQADH